MADAIRHRLWDMDLAGGVDEKLLDELRQAAAGTTGDVYAIKVQLGRALQKRALALLGEAITVLREAVDSPQSQSQPTRRLVAGQADVLAELQEDFGSLVDRLEKRWVGMKDLGHAASRARRPVRSRVSGGVDSTTPDHHRSKCRFSGSRRDGPDHGQREAVALSATQDLIVRPTRTHQRHRERGLESGAPETPAPR